MERNDDAAGAGEVQSLTRTADVAEPVRVLILDHFADELRTVLAEPLQRVLDVVHGEHDAQIA